MYQQLQTIVFVKYNYSGLNKISLGTGSGIFKLSDNYPNPFNPTTTITFSIPEKSFVTLKVYDMLGREVAEFVNEELETGSFEKTFDANNLASGIYIYRITAMKDGKIFFNESRRMLLIK
ncbi:MAG: T9SS type A sorting domain-containing protein [Ignavibacteriales bacterium]|nr:T9SS type A sorting domain-containing protein [Ignavibacteriales bacterium]